MFEVAGTIVLTLLTLQAVKFLLARGIVLSSRRERAPSANRCPLHSVRSKREQESQQGQPRQEHEAQRWSWRQAEEDTQSEGNDWWYVLEVSPNASAAQIRQSYLRKIKQSHPDRVAWLAPKLLELAERRSK